MHQIGNKKFLKLPGNQTIELPPIIVSAYSVRPKNLETCLDAIREKSYSIIGYDLQTESQPTDEITINIFDSYIRFREKWILGEIFFRWVYQCRIERNINDPLRPFLSKVWPDDLDLIRFSDLLDSKQIELFQNLHNSIGIRRMFDRLPTAKVLSDYLLTRQDTIGNEVFNKIREYDTELFPTERFHFEVINLQDL